MTKLNWADIFIDASHLDLGGLLKLWPNTVSGALNPIGASAFGDCFFQRRSGQIERLDVLEGGIHAVASNFEEFSAFMNSPEWQESVLLTRGIALLHERGMVRKPDQFFGFAPHPAFVGKIDWARVMPLDALVWHNICAQVLDARVSGA